MHRSSSNVELRAAESILGATDPIGLRARRADPRAGPIFGSPAPNTRPQERSQARTRTEAAASSSGPMGPMKFASLATSFVACAAPTHTWHVSGGPQPLCALFPPTRLCVAHACVTKTHTHELVSLRLPKDLRWEWGRCCAASLRLVKAAGTASQRLQVKNGPRAINRATEFESKHAKASPLAPARTVPLRAGCGGRTV